MISLFLLFMLCLIIGFSPLNRLDSKTNDAIIVGFSLILVFLFGYQITGVAQIPHFLPFFGKALILSLASVSGSILFSIPLFLLLKKVQKKDLDSVTRGKALDKKNSWKLIGITFIFIILGMITGIIGKRIQTESPIQVTLHCMVAFIGIQAGKQLQRYKREKSSFHFRFTSEHLIYLLGIPTSVIVGTLVFSTVTGVFIGIGWKDGALCGAPLGWQTLGGPVVQEFRGVTVGSLAFMVNMIRDCLSLLLIPLLAMSKIPLLAITPGGVSSMDILLPSIVKTTGKKGLLPAIWIGACCSFWAPLLLLIINQIES